jgi:molybdenum cofactor biosynthesis enzyme MoaA
MFVLQWGEPVMVPAMTNEIRLNYLNFPRIKALTPTHYSVIRFDSNNQCNVHCAYCHISRSGDVIELDDFRSFLDEGVLSVDLFQFGCQMEPTMDPRLCDFMQALAASPARPRRGIRLQTNGILLHRHATDRMVEAGLKIVTVSVDSANASTQKGLRGGTSLAKVQRNVVEFLRACPTVRVGFITVVTSDNIEETGELVAWGREAGVAQFEFRQMVHYPDNSIVDHQRMEILEVTREQFDAMEARLRQQYGETTALYFYPAERLHQHAAQVLRASLVGSQAEARPF